MSEKLRVGILGGTGMVGQRFITLLENHPWFDVVLVAASGRSAGKLYEDAVEGRWKMQTAMPEFVKKMPVYDMDKDFDEIVSKVDFVFCAVNMPKAEIKALEERYAKAEVPVVSNNSANRWTPDVPMILPEVNPEHTKVIEAQKKRLGTTRGFIAVKPNCSIQSYAPALAALKEFEPKLVVATTYQAISGAGKTFEQWPEMVENIIPYIGGEEEKSEKIVFSSSATVYGEQKPPYVETMPRGACSNPYGWTKAMMEQILTDCANADSELTVILLRYFNPIGAHPSGKIGEDPQGIPNNLMPYVSQVAAGRREQLTIFGGDYDTPDGTCRRDYIHVVDLACGHLKAVEYAQSHKGVEIFNLGTGTPYSVLEIVNAFESSTGVKINYVIGDRRPGDLPDSWADASKAAKVLGWEAKKTLEDMCKDSWNWQSHNPNGYRQ